MNNPESTSSDLEKIRALIRELIPSYIEEIKYGIPTVIYKGKNLIHFAEYKDHIGIYPGPEAINAFKEELKTFGLSKGTIRIPKELDLPINLIKKIVQFRIKAIDQQ
ncbi:MAG TPA: DUF1801 domain-containing protein [Candidatus Dojkabacteria bacterium]|jgi:uncharacterized protein YdhG (YjbR/CyaY superfamily)|nr:DUF1801 domain-containing protein [Candidatus Dojkabacteria bacterium]